MKTLKYWEQKELHQYDGQENPIELTNGGYEKEEALRVLDEMPNDEFFYHPATRNSHFTALNCLPVVVGTRWTISEDVYYEFLEMLPPISRKAGGFYISEANCGDGEGGNIRSAYFKEGGRFWHAYESTRF